MKFHNKLDIGNADIAIIRNKRRGFKELLISYKTIYMNTYTLQVVDIAPNHSTGVANLWTMFKLENF